MNIYYAGGEWNLGCIKKYKHDIAKLWIILVLSDMLENVHTPLVVGGSS